MTSEQRWTALFWLAALFLLFFSLYELSSMVLPFVAGMAIAYFLDPAVDRLERWRVPRGLGTALVLSVFLLFLVAVVMLLWPLLALQVRALVQVLPGLFQRGQVKIQQLVEMGQERLSADEVDRLRDMLGNAASSVVTWLGGFLERVFVRGVALVNLAELLIITPVVAFFLLRDWDRIVIQINGWLPRQYAETIREQARLVNATLAGFVHGQVLVSLTLAIYYAILLSVARLHYAVVIGLIIGILSIVPFVGVTICFVMTMGIALLQFGMNLPHLATVFGIFVVGQLAESNVLSPKLVGERVNLHPVWIIFALLAFGTLFGFVGVLLALPAAAVIGVLVRFGLSRYLASPLYDPANRHSHDER